MEVKIVNISFVSNLSSSTVQSNDVLIRRNGKGHAFVIKYIPQAFRRH